jgi:hypothetical protein
MDGIVSRSRLVNGVPTSLKDLGYSDVGLDDAWQLCGKYGPNEYTYHDEKGKPVIDTALFPDFNGLTDYAHSLGLTAGYVCLSLLSYSSVMLTCLHVNFIRWYGNNCICEDHCDSDACYEEDVNSLVGLGFDRYIYNILYIICNACL